MALLNRFSFKNIRLIIIVTIFYYFIFLWSPLIQYKISSFLDRRRKYGLQHNIFLYLRRMESLSTDFSEDQLEIFYKLAKSDNALIRSQVAVLLADHYTPRSEELLFELLDDPEDLVRTKAADSMGIGRSIKSLEKIFEMLQSDPYYLA